MTHKPYRHKNQPPISAIPRRAFLAWVLLFANNIDAQSLLIFSAGYDAEESSSASLTLDYEFDSLDRLILYVDHTDDSFRQFDLSSQTKSVEYLMTTDSPLAVGFGYEEWGNGDDFSVETYRLELDGLFAQWRLNIQPQSRTIKIKTGRPARILQKLENGIDSTGLSLAISYFGFNAVDLTAYASKYQYDEDVSQLNPQAHPIVLFIFTPSSLNLTQSLEDFSFGLDGQVVTEHGSIGARFHRSRAAIDGRESDTISTNFGYSLSEQWRVGSDIGVQISDDSDSTAFVRGTLYYQW